MILISKINEVYSLIDTTESIHKEIEKLFSYKVTHYVPNKQYWNFLKTKGMKMSLYTKNDRKFKNGLLPDLIEFFKKSNYHYQIKGSFNSINFSEVEALEFIKSLNLP